MIDSNYKNSHFLNLKDQQTLNFYEINLSWVTV